MQKQENMQAFVKTSNISALSKAIQVSRPSLMKLRDGNFNVNYKIVVAVSDYMDQLIGDDLSNKSSEK